MSRAQHRTVFMAAYTNYRRDPRVRREAQALVDVGYRVTFLACRQKGEPDFETIDGVDVVKARVLNNRRTSIVVYLLDYLLFFASVVSHLTVHPRRYALIHINNMPDFLVFAAWLPRFLGVPVIHDVHDLMPELFEQKFDSRLGRWSRVLITTQERWAGRFATAVLTVEGRLKDILSARGVPQRKIHILMNLPDDQIFRARAESMPKVEKQPFVLAYHGTLAHRLGLDIAVRAVHLARLKIPSIELRIIGAGEERNSLIRLRDELGLGSVVSFSEGFVPVQSIPGLLADVDVGICPLRVSSGTDIMLPTKLLEYVTIGIVCIVPRTGTICRYFDEQMVQFFEAENVESLAAAIVALHVDPLRRQSLAREATRRFATTYRWTRHKEDYTRLVEDLIARREPSHREPRA
jgi:glycosyltransferase involved in cell wall biosynthesis